MRDGVNLDNPLIACIRSIANNFAALADEMEKHDIEINTKLNYVENEVVNNRQALRDAANAILGRLE